MIWDEYMYFDIKRENVGSHTGVLFRWSGDHHARMVGPEGFIHEGSQASLFAEGTWDEDELM